MPRCLLGRVGAVAIGCLAVGLAACTPDLPASVSEGSTVTVGWSGTLTSANAAVATGATQGNREVASLTRGRFARADGGEIAPDEGFGRVEVIDPDPESFTVRYDLAETAWSDGIPVDGADLMLAWAAGSNALAPDAFDSGPGDLTTSTEVPELDEFDRRIDVRFDAPVRDWHTALDVAAPAHVVGMAALGIDDPMEAKQAVITAIDDGDADDLAAIAEEWNTGFELDPGAAELPERLTVSSGPYRLDTVEEDDAGDRVRLVVNREYDGSTPPTYEAIELAPAGATRGLEQIGDGLDVVQVSPTEENFSAVRALERRDHQVATTHQGALWALLLRTDRGVFRSPEARLAFLRTVPRSDLRSAGAGAWSEAYAASDSLLFDPESSGYTVATEDAGLRQALNGSESEAAVERDRAGVPAGTTVCVLHDSREPFAGRAVQALRTAIAESESGWRVRGCGAKGADTAAQRRTDWQAVLTRIPIPESPRELAAQWGSDAPIASDTETAAQRDRILTELARTADPYVARDLRVALETLVVSDAVAVPLATDPVVTVTDREVEGVQPASGRSATLLSGAAGWSPAD
ncbi:hypothetical protein KUV85_07885 [Nocardioides panacisoli]|uniref:hypothetical protein n=1 Tax=Nocardioides panacisoli TaxID=627624 RepID=UPI001C63A55F|nr:hypothetical protein [Nocardioides panacisoli]QYJ05585.1 hypothetical protein KUV85_07885 [Nocardioides panacisoli]